MTTKRVSLLRIIFLLSLIITCLGGVLLAALGFEIPEQTGRIFGPASDKLSKLKALQYSFELFLYQDQMVKPGNPDSQSVKFTIEPNESVGEIAERLQNEGLIQNSDIFITFLKYSGLDTRIQAGSYQLDPADSAIKIARMLQDATPQEVDLFIFEGWRLEEIALSLETSGLNISSQSFVDLTKSNPVIFPSNVDFPTGASLEGFLFPGKYTFDREINVNELINTLVEHFEVQLTTDMIQGFSDHGLSVFQAVTLASIVQRESVVVEEMPIIASVFYNRLEAGMKLDSDPTIQYALGYDFVNKTWWKHPLVTNDFQVISAYNTYNHVGLPPGPISNPGIDALRAVAYPDSSDYFYFRATCDGSGKHSFAVSFEEHLKNGCP
jgi:UPF0755 protein